MLTRKQRELLDYIGTFIATEGYGPSFEEMKEAMGLKSKSGIHRLVSGLVERGFIESPRNKARAITIHNPLASVPTRDLQAEIERREHRLAA